MKSKLLFFLAVLAISLETQACSCIGPNTFLESVASNILEAKYMGFDSIVEKQPDGRVFRWYFKKLVLVEIWQSSGGSKVLNSDPKISLGDTFFLQEGNGGNCLGYLHDALINEHYVLSISDFSLMHGPQENLPVTDNLVVSLSLCSEPVLWLSGDEVLGNISNNKVFEKTTSADRYLSYAQIFREKQYQYESNSFGRKYYEFWAQLNEEIYSKKRKKIMSKGNYYERGQTWSRERLKNELEKIAAKKTKI